MISVVEDKLLGRLKYIWLLNPHLFRSMQFMPSTNEQAASVISFPSNFLAGLLSRLLQYSRREKRRIKQLSNRVLLQNQMEPKQQNLTIA
jgi:hypothetical protein